MATGGNLNMMVGEKQFFDHRVNLSPNPSPKIKLQQNTADGEDVF